MKNIKTISNKKFSLKFSKWELNAISFTRACNIPHEACKPLDLNKFFYEFEKEHGLLNINKDKEVKSIRDIKKISKKRYHLKLNTWYLNPISVVRAYNLPDDQYEVFDIDKFFYEFEKEHGLLNIVAEDYENYSYS